MSNSPVNWTKEQAYEHYRERPEDEIRAAVEHSSKTGPVLLGALKALQEVQDRKQQEIMVAAATANSLSRTSLKRANWGLLVSVLAILTAIAIAVWQHHSK